MMEKLINKDDRFFVAGHCSSQARTSLIASTWQPEPVTKARRTTRSASLV